MVVFTNNRNIDGFYYSILFLAELRVAHQVKFLKVMLVKKLDKNLENR
jgi:hypothetical protein